MPPLSRRFRPPSLRPLNGLFAFPVALVRTPPKSRFLPTRQAILPLSVQTPAYLFCIVNKPEIRLCRAMPIPEFNEIKAPAMQFFADGKPHKVSEIYDVLAKHFNLTEEELNEVLPSGTQRRWHNRANWACYPTFPI